MTNRIPKRLTLTAVCEIVLWPFGVVCLGLFSLLQWQDYANAQDAVEAFYAERDAGTSPETFSANVRNALSQVDQSLWSSNRVAAFQKSQRPPDAAVGVMRIERLSLEVPVFEGAGERELDRGPGWIRGTSQIGERGNIGIAGHRDGFFRALKDIEPGDTIEILGPDISTRYEVTDTWVVDPDAVHVLDPTLEPAVTLVTCYPFYFVGHAPQRFIVRATAVESL